MTSKSKNENQNLALTKLNKMAVGEWICEVCNQLHNSLPDLGTNAPHVVGVPDEVEDNSALRMDGSFLSEDFCVIDGRYFMVRTSLQFPIQGLASEFGFGVWSTLSQKNFEIYLESFDDGYPEDGDDIWFSWLMTNLTYFGQTFQTKTNIVPQPDRQRPHVVFIEEDHPIYKFQKNGISPVELLEIYGYYGCRP